ncbi:MAG TPA: GH92 family glycosyl hydrolase, partial [Flavobacteriales bacterium]|nr:GH92 family glycosyl hydrolase [Flavobacteriales bacterium]
MTGIIAMAQQTNPARNLVNPFIGTGGHGHTFPGACVPNGLVQLSPDTRPDGYMDWDGCGGYHYSDSVIYGFSHTHLSGTGVADLCDVLLMPMSGAASFDPSVYRSSFQHKNEEAHAGYYRVWLDEEKTLAEVTATAHCGVHRYTMPADKEQFLVLDLNHRDKLLGHSIRKEGLEIVGERRSGSWARDQRLFFCIRIGRSGGPVGIGLELNADSTRGSINVKREDTSAIIVKVGISAVSIEGARKNLDAEVPHWDFDKVRGEAEAAWNTKLNKIQVEGGTREQQRIFYTALYHSYVAPYIFNDVDGQYRGMDGEVHYADHNVYTVFSLWDTFRGLHPLMTILEPDMTSDWIKTFLLHYQQGGRLPVWELWGNETDCMIGYHSVSVIADAYMKGIRGFDERLALKAMMEGARLDHFGLKAYQERGFMSSEDGAESVSRTLEYAYDDACIAAFAARLERIGGDDQQLDFRTRSASWRHLFDRSSGFFRARRNGGLAPGFDPYEVNFNFTEANAWQYSLFVPQDIDGLVAAHGGPE